MKVKLEIRHYMILALSILAIYGMFTFGFDIILLHVLTSLLAALFVDILINYFKLKEFTISLSTIITSLIVAEVVSFDPSNHLIIVVIASIIAILSKHILVYNKRHIFNPAAFGIIAVSLIFPGSISWWASSNIWLTIILALFILYRLRKYELTLSYLISHTIVFSLFAFANNLAVLQYILLANPYFLGIMLIEPITSPTKKKQRIVYGSLVALISLPISLLFSLDDTLLALLATNFIFIFAKRLKWLN